MQDERPRDRPNTEDIDAFDKLIRAFESGPLEPKQRTELIKALGRETVFELLAKLNDRQVEKMYGMVSRFGPEIIGIGPAERLADVLIHEINARDNRASFEKMKGLTWIAIGLAAFQVFWEIFKTIYLGK